MFIPDETHDRIMRAGEGLRSVSASLEEADWALRLLTFLISAHDLSPEAAMTALDQLDANRDRIQHAEGLIQDGLAAVLTAASTLEYARSKIPNTTPPDPRGFESCDSSPEA